MLDHVDVTYYFLQTGIGWAVLGGVLAFAGGCIGSALGIRIAAAQTAGVLSEKPDLFGKLLVLTALPGTQGFYGFICMFLIAFKVNLAIAETNEAALALSPAIGAALLAVGAGVGIVQWWSAKFQGETSAAAINLVAKRPEESGRSILFPALVETYSVVALLAGILMIFWPVSYTHLTLPTSDLV